MHGEYRVVGRRAYRGHDPGTTFRALIKPDAERRAIDRGDITLIRRIQPGLQDGRYRLPEGWVGPPERAASQPSTEAPQGASLVSGGG